MSERKNPAAVALGRKGGKAAAGKGGKIAQAKLTPAQRKRRMKALAAKSVAARKRRGLHGQVLNGGDSD